MSAINPGHTTNLVPNAHYHHLAATKTWAAFIAAMQVEATDPADERAARDEQRERETTYARGELGRS